MHKSKRLDSIALGWMALAIFCTALLAYPDLLDGADDRATDLIGGWFLIGKVLLAICLFRVATYTVIELNSLWNEFRTWRLERTEISSKIIPSIRDEEDIPGADPKKLARLNSGH